MSEAVVLRVCNSNTAKAKVILIIVQGWGVWNKTCKVKNNTLHPTTVFAGLVKMKEFSIKTGSTKTEKGKENINPWWHFHKLK